MINRRNNGLETLDTTLQPSVSWGDLHPMGGVKLCDGFGRLSCVSGPILFLVFHVIALGWREQSTFDQSMGSFSMRLTPVLTRYWCICATT
jgi:hypothetical protein